LSESSQFTQEIGNINSFGIATFQKLPEWVIGGKSFGIKSLVANGLQSLVSSINQVEDSLLPIFTQIVGYTLKFLVFLVASFYLLKDGHAVIEKMFKKFPSKNATEIREVGRRINVVLGGYLRGQILLILIMGVTTSIILTLLGIKYALILGLITGFLELIPFVGPVIATTLVAGIAFITGENSLSLDPTKISLVVIVIYFTLRQLEDYFVIPQLLGRLTRLHPLLVLFSILTSGAIAGPIGFILGVPVAASARVLLEYYWEKVD
jgi:predicted PurR-regulated permease PerM